MQFNIFSVNMIVMLSCQSNCCVFELSKIIDKYLKYLFRKNNI